MRAHNDIRPGADWPDLCSRALSWTFAPIELFAQGRRSDPTQPSFFNFGLLRIAADGLLRVEIRNAEGLVPYDQQGRPGSLLLTLVR